jgi:hypothetical protein
MSYFIFLKNADNIEGTIYKIAENEADLNFLNIFKNDYKIIQDTQENFNAVKFGTKFPSKYNGDIIVFSLIETTFNKKSLEQIINNYKNLLQIFLDNNPNHPLFSRWNSYYNQLNNLDLDSITYPLNKSLEQYFNDLGKPSYNILQVP